MLNRRRQLSLVRRLTQPLHMSTHKQLIILRSQRSWHCCNCPRCKSQPADKASFVPGNRPCIPRKSFTWRACNPGGPSWSPSRRSTPGLTALVSQEMLYTVVPSSRCKRELPSTTCGLQTIPGMVASHSCYVRATLNHAFNKRFLQARSCQGPPPSSMASPRLAGEASSSLLSAACRDASDLCRRCWSRWAAFLALCACSFRAFAAALAAAARLSLRQLTAVQRTPSAFFTGHAGTAGPFFSGGAKRRASGRSSSGSAGGPYRCASGMESSASSSSGSV